MLTQAILSNELRTSSFPLPDGFSSAPAVLAMGAELKSSFCLLERGHALLSEANGDLEQAEVFRAYSNALESSCAKQHFKPENIALDMHPDYLSTQMGQKLATRYGCEITRVQHHHAHIAACLAEYTRPLHAGPVLGIALDGLGFGEDGTIWGGEFLLADYTGFTRLACFQPVAMPGGTQAIHEPWRNTLAHLHTCGWDAMADDYPNSDIIAFLKGKPLPLLHTMLDKGLNSPLASSAGRLFDAVAACLDIHRKCVTHEGQAAIELEKMATTAMDSSVEPYPFVLHTSPDGLIQLQWKPMWQGLLSDAERGVDKALIAASFHKTMIAAVSELGLRLTREHGLDHVALSGGVFQNRLLRLGVEKQLQERDLSVLIPQQAPVNDGGLALGQAAVAAARLLKDIEV